MALSLIPIGGRKTPSIPLDTMTETILELSAVPEDERGARLTAAFEALPPGGLLYFSTAEDPRRVLRPLVAQLWGRFNWAPLEVGDGHWLSQLIKRERPGPTGLEDMLEEDHRRCDDLFAAAESAAQQGDQQATERLFRRLEVGMERHFTIEEEGFFQEVEQRMGFMGGGPVAVMRDEHKQMRGMLRRLAGALADGNLEDFLAATETMLYLMEQHNMKEEQMLYPMAEDAFGAEMDELLQRLYLF